MRAKTKQHFIESWTEYIRALYTLALCSNPEQSKAVTKATNTLMDLVSPIADTKPNLK